MSSAIESTLADLQKARAKHEAVLVSYSGGKDSLVVLDLCARTFKKVVCFFMFFVPGLEVCERQMRYAWERWKAPVLQYPHWAVLRCLKRGLYMPPSNRYDDVPEMKLADVQRAVCSDSGISLIADGGKRSDSAWRRRNMKSTKGNENLLHPLAEWNKFDVLAYAKHHDIPLPDSSGRQATGVDLSTPSILWLHDEHPDDFQKLLDYFPYAEAVVKRRELYGVA